MATLTEEEEITAVLQFRLASHTAATRIRSKPCY